jgi:hypothetical protein
MLALVNTGRDQEGDGPGTRSLTGLLVPVEEMSDYYA